MRLIRKTATVTRQVLARKKYRRICALIAVLYLLAFLLAVQNLSIPGGGTAVRGGNLSAMFQRTGFLLFDAVAIVRIPAFTLLVSPVNILMGVVLSVFVGLNLTLCYIAWRQPRACSVNKATGTLGILPALLAGGACCAPTVLLILGIQATAALITASQWMIPLAFVLLIGSLVWISQKTQPEFL